MVVLTPYEAVLGMGIPLHKLYIGEYLYFGHLKFLLIKRRYIHPRNAWHNKKCFKTSSKCLGLCETSFRLASWMVGTSEHIFPN